MSRRRTHGIADVPERGDARAFALLTLAVTFVYLWWHAGTILAKVALWLFTSTAVRRPRAPLR